MPQISNSFTINVKKCTCLLGKGGVAVPEKLRYTLKNLGTQIYSSKNKPPIIRKIPKYKELKFFEAIFPSAFLEGPRATLFADYEERNNPTRNKIFNGTYHGDPRRAGPRLILPAIPAHGRDLLTTAHRKWAVPAAIMTASERFCWI